MASDAYNKPVDGIPYFAPVHQNSPGTPLDPTNAPTLFKPLQIRGATLKNRIIVAPMCQYSSAESGPLTGALTPYHLATLGHYALKGAALVFTEATGVQPNGRISPHCPGIWSDAQIDGFKAVADFVHTQGALLGVQLAHAGRKSSTAPPYIASRYQKPSIRSPKDVGGWPDNVVGPTGGEEQTWDGKRSDDPEGGFYAPRELSVEEIQQLVRDWASAAVRCVRAGTDVLEIHAAHGYLLHEFLSPVTNRRNDSYGGSFENRIRLLVEIVHAIREVIPASMPLFLRVSSTEWLEETEIAKSLGSWDVESTIKLAKVVADLGVDLLDVSSGGNHPEQRINMFNSKDYQTKIAAQIRQACKAEDKKMLIGAVGLITEAQQARDIVENDIKHEAQVAVAMTNDQGRAEPMADVILVGRQFMREPEWVLKVAWRLGVDIGWPSQFLRVRFPRL
jgi:2,4-dienoyl-CoA reductase-like NADH-dependent reductase (Old Yellow Enzyme family)